MQSETLDRTTNGRIGLGLGWVGLLAIVASVGATVLVRLLAAATLNLFPASLELLGYGSVIALTTLGVLGAVIVFALLVRLVVRLGAEGGK